MFFVVTATHVDDGRYSLLVHHSREELKAFGLTHEMLLDQEWYVIIFSLFKVVILLWIYGCYCIRNLTNLPHSISPRLSKQIEWPTHVNLY